MKKFFQLHPLWGGVLSWAVPCCAMAIYVFSCEFNGFLDMPSHMARSFIMMRCFRNPSDAVCSNFDVALTPVPYFFADLTLIFSLAVLSPMMAEKAAIFFLLTTLIGGWNLFFRRVVGSLNIGYMAGLSLITSRYLYNGFYAFVLSVATALVWLAYWWKIRDHKTWRNQIALSLGLAVLFGIHLAGFLFVFILYLSHDVHRVLLTGRARRLPDFIAALRQSALVHATFFALYIFQQLCSRSLLESISYKYSWSKLPSTLYPFVGYWKSLDVGLFVLMVAILIFARRIPRLSVLLRNFWFCSSLVFFLLYYLFPIEAHGVYGVDTRFLMMGYFSLFAAFGSFSLKRAYCSVLLGVLLLSSFCLNLYFRNVTSLEITKVADVLELVPRDKSLTLINSIGGFPDSSASLVRPFVNVGSYHILNGGNLVGGLFDCRINKNIQYFCYEDQSLAGLDYVKYQTRGITQVDSNDLSILASSFDYVLVIGKEEESFIKSKLSVELFTPITQKDYIYLFRSKLRLTSTNRFTHKLSS